VGQVIDRRQHIRDYEMVRQFLEGLALGHTLWGAVKGCGEPTAVVVLAWTVSSVVST
jgi:hypothetical protein